MRIRKFEASSVQEALQQVRQELGPDAVILYTRKIRRGGFLGLGSLELAEVTAGVDLGPETSANGTTPAYTGLAERGAVLGAVQLATSTVRESPSLPRTKPSFSRSLVSSATGLALERRQEIYQSELNDGKVLAGLSISRSAPRKTGPDLHPELRRVMDLMIKNGVEESVAQNALMPAQREIVEKGYPRAGTLGQLVSRTLASQLKVSGPIEGIPGRPRVIAFIGPTGVGKTTTLVKLASQYALVHQMKVALLTADTYRIGAVEQLRIYRDIMDIPFEAVNSPEDLGPALKRHADRDLIFFDTAGRSPQNRRQIQDLKAFLEVAKPSETHLCVSATTKNADLMPIVGKFGLVPINRFLVTKLDETRQHGLLLNLAANFQVPISYLTNGQSVPHDIEVATPERMVDLVLGETRG